MNGLGRLIDKYGEAECASGANGPRQMMARNPTLAERVQINIQQYESEIVKLREIEKLLSENPQIEQLINALGAANLRY